MIDVTLLWGLYHPDGLTTADLGRFIPRIVNKYGRKYVDFDIKILPDSMCEIGEGLMVLSANT